MKPGLYRRRRDLIDVIGPTMVCVIATALIVVASLLLTRWMLS